MNENSLIIVLVGESGSGKSFIRRQLFPKYPNIKSITKYTTRKERIDEQNVDDIKADTDKNVISSLKYNYFNPISQEWYGFDKNEIDDILSDNKIPCLELSNEDIYKEILEDYQNQVLLLNIIPYFNEQTMKETFENQGRENIEYEKRKVILDNPLTSWVQNYDNVRQIINPHFLKSIPLHESINILVQRIEHILVDECNKDLGASYRASTPNELYRYLYYYSKNRPIDQEMVISINKSNKI